MPPDPGVQPSLDHRLQRPLAQDLVRQYFESLPRTPELPAMFRGPNWKKKESWSWLHPSKRR
ncbi:hypothetical protein [Streptomyces sp. NPDC088775]|uniref:hypothetical protein n=1 Tax=Streptomyces sp. NPDC088775 TaxID=3365896 RepID=UPI003817929C